MNVEEDHKNGARYTCLVENTLMRRTIVVTTSTIIPHGGRVAITALIGCYLKHVNNGQGRIKHRANEPAVQPSPPLDF